MCGIFAYLLFKGKSSACETCGCTCNSKGGAKKIELRRPELISFGSRLRHRGPDWSGIFSDTCNKLSILMVHERLSIIDTLDGSQPLTYDLPSGHKIALCVNGEIFNYLKIKSETPDYPYKTKSDSEVIIALYLKYRDSLQQMLESLDGQFSFILYDSERNKVIVARDPIGITSLYYSRNITDESLIVASEMKAIPEEFEIVEQFPPGCFIEFQNNINDIRKTDYYSNSEKGAWKLRLVNEGLSFIDIEKSKDEEVVYGRIREILTEAVRKRLMSDVPFGMLLSGGLDSSLVCSIAVRLLNGMRGKMPWLDVIRTFAIGLEGSPDLQKAQEVADYLGTYHYSFKFTIQEGIDAISEVVYHLETYDITTIRASTPMYLLSRRIKSTAVKMVLSGEGSDEILGGYLYFLNAPSNVDFNKECHRRTANLNKFDCLRADKSTMSWGVEGRYPFLDNEFISYAIDLDPELKRKNNIEKYVLRKAFDLQDESTGKPMYLASDILWRQKEQFSDGVGYGWIDSLVAMANEKYTNEEFESKRVKYTINSPSTKEALMYREIFETRFVSRANTIDYWVPRTDWANVGADPSGRAQKSHLQAYVPEVN